MIYLEEEFRDPVKYELSKKGYDERYGTWEPLVFHVYENTDWENVLDKVNRAQKAKYIVKRVQEKIDAEELFNGKGGNGITGRWVTDLLKKKYGPARS